MSVLATKQRLYDATFLKFLITNMKFLRLELHLTKVNKENKKMKS